MKEIVDTASLTSISREEIRIVEVGVDVDYENGDGAQQFPYWIIGVLSVIGVVVVIVVIIYTKR